MPLENQHTLNSMPSMSGKPAPGSEGESENLSAGQASAPAVEERNLLSEHKGKLAIGAAAMLGMAIFYKWREHQLAKEDPQQYQQLRRIKSAVETDGVKPHKKHKTEKGSTR
ncbi:MAG TPA: hypothetical protein VJ654_20995 [Noviherbaspirillum sp.]|nr:hypothetical protein [Noviherbaspirillum sp.]